MSRAAPPRRLSLPAVRREAPASSAPARFPVSGALSHPLSLPRRAASLLLALLLSLSLFGCGKTEPPDPRAAVDVPILMYHALCETRADETDMIISRDAFREQMEALQAAGYTTVFFSRLVDYVENGAALPAKPLVVSFDDGYESNLTIAAPILEELGMCATVAVIGVSAGKNSYKDTGVAMLPHFGCDDARVWYEKGVLDFQSHTYDLHRNDLDTDYREGVLPRAGEDEASYTALLRADWQASRDALESGIGNRVFVLVYPFGKTTNVADTTFVEEGAEVTVTTDYGISCIERGNRGSLRRLKRIHADGSFTGDALVAKIGELMPK